MPFSTFIKVQMSFGLTIVAADEKSQCSSYSPNRACLYRVLAMNLLISWGRNVWPRAEDVVVFSQTAVPFTFSIRHFSESCCGCSETHDYVLRHPCSDPWVAHFCHTSLLIFTFSNCVISLRPSLSSKSFKNDSQ